MRIGPIGLDLPQLCGLALGVAESESQALSIRRPAQPKGQTGGGNQPVRIAAVGCDDGQFVAVGNQQAAAVGHPGCVVSQDIGYAAGIASEGGNDPQRLLGLGLQVTVDHQFGAVRGKRADQWRANFRGKIEVADFAVCSQGNRQHRVAVVHVREVEAGSVANRAGEALHIQIIQTVGENMAGVGDLDNAIGPARGWANVEVQTQAEGRDMPAMRPTNAGGLHLRLAERRQWRTKVLQRDGTTAGGAGCGSSTVTGAIKR